MDPIERAQLESTARAAIAAADGPAAIDAALADLGWLEMLEAEPRDAADIVFNALGASNATGSALDDVIVSALGTSPNPDLAVLLPRFGAWDAPGRSEDGRVCAVGLATSRAATARELLVVFSAEQGLRATAVPSSALHLRAVHGIDPDAGIHEVRIEPLADIGTPLGADSWETAMAYGRRAVARQIAGAGRAMLAFARDHALTRVQFGRPIASFQAVRHRLADALVAVEALEATLTAAGDEPNPLTAALAKATAGRSARIVAAQCQQVLAGIGFTTDHPFHRFLKRTMMLDGLLGSADEISVEIGRQLLAARHVPTLIEL